MQCHIELLLDTWMAQYNLAMAILNTTAEAFDSKLYFVGRARKSIYYYACVYTSDWNGLQQAF